MKYRQSIVLILSVITIMMMDSMSYSQSHMTIPERVRSRNLQGNLDLLNYWGTRPEYIQEFYGTVFNQLSKHPNASFSDVAKCQSCLKMSRKHGIYHLGGPMLGNASDEGVDVWVRTVQPSKVEIHVSVEGNTRIFGPVSSTPESDLTAVVPVRGLKPGNSYSYQAYVDGNPVEIDPPGVITTLPPDLQKGVSRIAFGTCPHRWGLGNERQADQILSRKPMALLLGGDIAVQDRNNHAGMHRADYLLRDFYPAWKKLSASVPVYATWDDHDYFDNDLYNIPEGFTKKDKETVWNVYRHAWNNPSYGLGENGKGIFFRTRIGPADVIMLDNRYFREKGSYLGDEQMEWLKEQLLDCKGPFIILSNGTMWSDYVSNGKDSWGVFDQEGREEIFNLIEENNIGGVLLISGDRHGTRGFKIPRPSGYNFYEFELGSLGGRTGPPPIRSDWDTQLYGVSGEYAFGEFEFDTTLPDPEVTFRLIRENGIVYYELTLSRSQLTP